MPVVGIYSDPIGVGDICPEDEYEMLKDKLLDCLPEWKNLEFKMLCDVDESPVDILIVDYGGISLGVSTLIEWIEESLIRIMNERPNCLIIFYTALDYTYVDFVRKVEDENKEFKGILWIKGSTDFDPDKYKTVIEKIKNHLEVLSYAD